MNEQWLASGAAILSLTLVVGWSYLQEKRVNDQFWQNISEQWQGRLAQFFYFVGIPYLAIISGLLSPQLLGLNGLEYFNLIDWGSDFLAVQIQQATTLMLLEWLLNVGMTVLAGSIAFLIFVGVWLSLRYQRLGYPSARESVLFTLYYALHWAFYRAVFWFVTGDLYLGVVLGSAFVLLEWAISQMVRHHFSGMQPGSGQQQRILVNAIILILTSTIFFYSPNLWLLLPIHLAMVAIVNRGWGESYQWKTQSGTS